MSYVEIPAETLFSFLEGKGFSRTVRYSEIVYMRKHHRDERYRVLIYTSVRNGARKARGRGKDAIRVCAVFEDGEITKGVAKLPKILRTGTVDDVLERTIERARHAYKVINKKLGPTPTPLQTEVERIERTGKRIVFEKNEHGEWIERDEAT